MSLFVLASAGINTASVSKRQDRWQKAFFDVIKTGAFVTYLKKKIKIHDGGHLAYYKAKPSPPPLPPLKKKINDRPRATLSWLIREFQGQFMCDVLILEQGSPIHRAGNELFYWPLAQAWGRVFIPSIEFEEVAEGEKTKFYTWKFRPNRINSIPFTSHFRQKNVIGTTFF